MLSNIENKDIIGRVHSFESFGSVDGPGVRFVIFLQGCVMRCKYCHNPETWSGGGDEWTPHDLFDKVYRYKAYWGKDGGITVSGGEPLLQIDFLVEFFKLAKKKRVHTTLDTSGQPFTMDEPFFSKFKALAEVTDLFMLDLKDWEEENHRRLTGFSNKNILQMAQWLSDNGKDMWIRHVLVPNLTDDENDLRNMGDFIAGLKTVKRVEVLPYHAFSIPKWEELQLYYELKDTVAPNAEQIKKAEVLLRVEEYH